MDRTQLILGILLFVSELLPFLDVRHNGIGHFFAICLRGGAAALKEELDTRRSLKNVTLPVTTPTRAYGTEAKPE